MLKMVRKNLKKNNYEEDFQKILMDICVKKNKKSIKIFDINGGQTDTLKRVVEFKDESLFIKIGEKVDRENQIYLNSFFKNELFLEKNKIFSGGNRLVLPYLNGVTLEEVLISEHLILNSDRLNFIKKILNKTFKMFWSQNLSSTEINLDEVIKNIEERTTMLYKENSDLAKIFSKSVIYKIDGNSVELPSIEKMLVKVLKTFTNINSSVFSCVTGDFQPSNIIITGQDFKIVDLSNGSDMADFALDVGKFFNFINRFHCIAKVRNRTNDETKKVGITVGQFLIVESLDYPDLLQRKLIESLEEDFSSSIVKNNGDYTFPDRLKLYKFVVNLITIRRHLKLGVPLESLISVLVDSYYELERKVFNI